MGGYYVINRTKKKEKTNSNQEGIAYYYSTIEQEVVPKISVGMANNTHGDTTNIHVLSDSQSSVLFVCCNPTSCSTICPYRIDHHRPQ